MSDTDPLAPALGASDSMQPAQAGSRRTLRGALATVVLALGLFAAMVTPTATVVALLLTPAVAAVAAVAVSYARQSSRQPVELCFPGTGRCLRV